VSLTPEEVSSATFPVEPQGYNRDEVRSFLEQVASRYGGALKDAQDLFDTRVELEFIRQSLLAAETTDQDDRAALRAAEDEILNEQERTKVVEAERDRLASRAWDLQLLLDDTQAACERYKAAYEAIESDAGVSGSDDSFTQFGDHLASVLRAATVAADDLQAEADQYARQARGQADEYATERYDNANQIVADARAESDEVRASADEYAKATRHSADLAVKKMKAKLDEEARRTIEAADIEAGRRINEAEEKVLELQRVESQFRRGLETVGEWVTQALATPTTELLKPKPMLTSRSAESPNGDQLVSGTSLP
jgi:DivIVA domain-containing protein